MLLRVLVLMGSSFVVGNCVIYNGTCPTREFKLHKNFSCVNIFGSSKRFKVLAHLPTSNASLNLFHNPLGAIDDLEVQLMCTGFEHDSRNEPEAVKFFLSCNETTRKGAMFSHGCNYKSLNMSTHSWSVIKDEGCKPATSIWNSVHLVNYVWDLYAVLWGCRELSKNLHEQGAWILGYKDNFAEAAKYLDQTLKADLSFASAPANDYSLYNETFPEKSNACSSKVCEYNVLCKNEAQDSGEEDL